MRNILVFLIFSDILPFLQASQVITVNEQLPLTPVEPEVMTERRTVKICCCIPKGDVLLNAWYINMFLFFLYSEALCNYMYVGEPLGIPLNVEGNDQLQTYDLLSVQHILFKSQTSCRQKSNGTLRQITFYFGWIIIIILGYY